MNSSDLPSDYDCIVLGTGMAESIIAAALSRNGLNVLHLDRYDYYSGDWSSFNFNAMQEWIKSKQDPRLSELTAKSYPESSVHFGEKCFPLCISSDTVRNIKQNTYVKEEAEVVDEKKQPDEDSVKVSEKLEKMTVSDELGEPGENSSDQILAAKQTKTQDCSDSVTVDKRDSGEQDVKSNELQSVDTCSGDVMDDSENVKEPSESPSNEDKKNESKKEWVYSEIKALWRKFNIDLMPKVLYCRGPMVELLISSDVAKYCEFKTVSRVLTSLKGKLEQVPCSRSDVFSSKLVSMIEKRMMMKYLTFCMEYDKHPEEYEGFEEKPYHEFLKSKKLTPNVQHFIQHSIAMVTDDTLTLKGLQATQMFLLSLGRYGNTAFLWPMYGSGELGQCFCRMCAVFGGVYCLKRTAQCLIVGEDNKCQAVIDTEGQRLNCKWLIAEASYVPTTLLSPPASSYTSRAVLITDRALQPESQEHMTLLSLPVEGLASPVTVLELPASSGACPSELYVVHLSCVCREGAEADLRSILDVLFQCQGDSAGTVSDNNKPCILWSLYFEMTDSTQCERAGDAPSNMYIVGGPNHVMDFDYSINKAKEIFNEICPGDEFLPKAPNPEDIIWDDGAGNQPTESGFDADTSLTDENNSETSSTSEQKDHAGDAEQNISKQEVAVDSKLENSEVCGDDAVLKVEQEKETDTNNVSCSVLDQTSESNRSST